MMATATRLVSEFLARPKPDEWRHIEETFKVPVEDSLLPYGFWLACVAVPEHDGLVPDDAEAAQIASYIDFVLSTLYNEGYASLVRARALPVCGGHNTAVFVKRADGWGYRRRSWHTGSWPHAYRGREGAPTEPLSLVAILDKITAFGEKPNPKWDAWKAAHSEVFP